MSEHDNESPRKSKDDEATANRRQALKLLGLLPLATVAAYVTPEIHHVSSAAADPPGLDDGLDGPPGLEDDGPSTNKKATKKKAKKKKAKKKATKKKATKKKAKKKVTKKKPT